MNLARVKKWAFFLVAALAVAFMVAMLGELLLLLALGFTAPVAAELGIHRLHVMGIAALVGTITLGFVAQLYRPRTKAAPLVLAAFASLAAVVAVAALDPASVGEVLPVFLFALVIALLHPGGRRLLGVGENYSPALLGLVAVAAVPLALFVVNQFTLQAIATDEHAMATHYVFMGLIGLTIIGGGVVAGLGLSGYRIAAWMTGLLAAYYGVLSVAFPDQVGSVGALWGALMILWGVAFVVAAELSRREGAQRVLRRPFDAETPAV